MAQLDRLKVQTATTAASADYLFQRLPAAAEVVAEMALRFQGKTVAAVVAQVVFLDKPAEQVQAAKDQTAVLQAQTRSHIAVQVAAVPRRPERTETLAPAMAEPDTHSAMAIPLLAAVAEAQPQAADLHPVALAAVAAEEVLPRQLAEMAEHIPLVVKPLEPAAAAAAAAAPVAVLAHQLVARVQLVL